MVLWSPKASATMADGTRGSGTSFDGGERNSGRVGHGAGAASATAFRVTAPLGFPGGGGESKPAADPRVSRTSIEEAGGAKWTPPPEALALEAASRQERLSFHDAEEHGGPPRAQTPEPPRLFLGKRPRSLGDAPPAAPPATERDFAATFDNVDAYRALRGSFVDIEDLRREATPPWEATVDEVEALRANVQFPFDEAGLTPRAPLSSPPRGRASRATFGSRASRATFGA